MTVANENNKTVQTGNGINTSFPFSFQVSKTDGSDIDVFITDTDGNTGAALSSGYLVTLNDPADLTAGGYVTYPYPISGTKLQTGEKITIARDVPITSGLHLENTGPFMAQNLEDAVDKLTMISQQLNEVSNRTLKADISVTSGVDYQLPSPVAGKVVGWDLTATKFQNYDNPGTAQIAAAESANLSEKWANESEDTEVETGKYSAYHWAQKAEDQKTAAATAATNAASSEANTAISESNALLYESNAVDALNAMLLSDNIVTAVYANNTSISITGLSSKTGIVVLNDGDAVLTLTVNSLSTEIKSGEEYIGFYASFTAFSITATDYFRVLLLEARA